MTYYSNLVNKERKTINSYPKVTGGILKEVDGGDEESVEFYSLETFVAEVESTVNRLKAQGFTTIKLYSGVATFNASRPETDEEWKARLEQETEQAQIRDSDLKEIERRERKMLEKLKKKYEDKE